MRKKQLLRLTDLLYCDYLCVLLTNRRQLKPGY